MPGNEVLPAGSVAVAVTDRHPPGYPGLVLTIPSVPATTVAVVPSG
ncbi:hypothetical protein H0H24_09345 [Acinetobacter baumannii]|nr:hypothetical protein H0H24_09345 [Acinetobacter baumannii]